MKMRVDRTVLKNGVRILTQTVPHVRSVAVGIWVAAGARDETPAENGLSHFLEHMIFKGTERRSAFRIAKEFDAIGGQSNAFTAMETTCYHGRVMDTHLPVMADILSDIFLNSLFAPEEIEKERPVIFQEIGMTEDSPEEYIHILSESAFWGDHPLGRPIIGSRENLSRFDREMLRGFFRKCYQPERVVITAAGSVDHNDFVRLIAPDFEAVQTEAAEPAERDGPAARRGLFLHDRDIEQVHICLSTPGIPVGDPRRYAASLLNTVLGGNMSSRLFQEVREQRGLAYNVYSFLASYSDTGLTGVYVGTSPEEARTATEIIFEQIDRLTREPVSESELRDAAEYAKGSLLMSAESVDNRMVRLAQNEIFLGRHVPLDEVIREIDAVTPEDIRNLAGALFQNAPQRDHKTLTLLGPLDDPTDFKGFVPLQ